MIGDILKSQKALLIFQTLGQYPYIKKNLQQKPHTVCFYQALNCLCCFTAVFFRSFSKQSYPALTKRDYLIITLMRYVKKEITG